MEFGDFGLFELLATLISLLSVHRFILNSLILKIPASLVFMASCVGLYLLDRGDLFYTCAGIVSAGTLMLIATLWKKELENFKTFFKRLINGN